MPFGDGIYKAKHLLLPD